MAATSSVSATTCDPMKFQAHDFLDPLIITPEVIRSALEPAIESLDLYMAGKYAGAVISGPTSRDPIFVWASWGVIPEMTKARVRDLK